MHDRLHVGALAVDPDVEAHARIGSAFFQRLEILVHQHHPLGSRLLEAVAELQGPEGAWFPGSRRHLSSEARLMIFAGKDAATLRQQLGRCSLESRQVRIHLATDAIDEVRLVALVHFIRLGRKVEITGKATRIASRTQSTVMNGSTPRKMARVPTCGSRVLRTKRFMPTGGLIRPISTTTTIRTPNQIGSRPRWTITGKNTGTVSRIIDSSSIAVPSRT